MSYVSALYDLEKGLSLIKKFYLNLLKVFFLQEFLTSRYAWQNLNLDGFDNFLHLVFPELDEKGKPIKVDDFSVVRMFTVSMLNILKFG